jgi:hypothetical protein
MGAGLIIGTRFKKWYWFFMIKNRKLWDTYRFPGFRPAPTIIGIFGDPKARVIRLIRRGKKQFVEPAERFTEPFTIERHGEFETFHVGILAFTWRWKSAGWTVDRAGK